MNSDYSSSLEKIAAEYPRAPRLARAFYSSLVSRCYRLVDIAPGGSKRFLEAYLERFLVEDMKRIFRAKHAGAALDRSMLIGIPEGYDYADLQAMSEAPTLQEAVKSLENTRFRGVADAMVIYQKYNLVSVIEAFLDKIYFDSEVRPCLDAVPRSAGVEEMVGAEVDLMDIKTLTDLKARGVAADEVRGVSFLPFELKAEEVARISEATLDSIPRMLSRTRYADLAQPIQNALDPANDESLDRAIRLEIRRRTKPLMFRWALSLGYVLGYVRDAETEANNLVSIVTGKELGLSESRIEGALCV